MSFGEPVLMVTSIKYLLSHTVNKPHDTLAMPMTMRISELILIPFVFCMIQMKYFNDQSSNMSCACHLSMTTKRIILIYLFFSAAMLSFRAAIFSSESLCFLRSRATTASGALATKRSLESFFFTPARKPSRCCS